MIGELYLEKKAAVIIPALNPDEKLVNTVKDVRKIWNGPVVIVDDGSDMQTRGFFQQAEQMNCTVLRHCVNLGKGRALKTAFNYCINTWPNILGCVTADADGQHTAQDIFRCVCALEENPKSLVLGCRDFEREEIPTRSKWGNKVTCMVMRLLCGVNVSDTQTGLRAVPLEFMKKLMNVTGERYEFETNMLLETQAQKVPLREIAIETIYIEENRRSHFRPLIDSVRIYALFLKFIFASLSSSVVDIALFSALVWTLKPFVIEGYIFAATVLARIASALFNYIVNSKAVFQKEMGRKTMLKYFALCIVQMCMSGLLVSAFYRLLPCSEVTVKICVDVLLFFISFQVQKRWIFS